MQGIKDVHGTSHFVALHGRVEDDFLEHCKCSFAWESQYNNTSFGAMLVTVLLHCMMVVLHWPLTLNPCNLLIRNPGLAGQQHC